MTFLRFSLIQLTWRKLACFVSVTNHRLRLHGRAMKNVPAAATKLHSLRPVLTPANGSPISRIHQERAYRSSGIPMYVPRRTRLIILSHFGSITTWPLERVWRGSSFGMKLGRPKSLALLGTIYRERQKGLRNLSSTFVFLEKAETLPFPAYRRQINSIYVKPRFGIFI